VFQQVAPSGELLAKPMIDSWHARAHRSAADGAGVESSSLAHAWRAHLKDQSFADECNRPVAFAQALGDVFDVITAVLLISAVAPPRRLIAEASDVDSWGRCLLSRWSSRSCVDLNESCS
jgi:hypothetical protein